MVGEEAFEGIPALTSGQWRVDAATGVVSLTEEVLAKMLNQDDIEKWYTIDPEPIARGQFAVVYHCQHRISGREYAAKFSSRWRMGSDCTQDLVHEIAVSAMLRPTPRAIHLVEIFGTDSELVLVMEYAEGGDMQTILDENLVPFEHDVIRFVRQLLEGLVFIHERNIVHLDIKPQNLVLMGEYPDCAIKLCDFEICRMLTPGHEVREILGTPDYVAPEILHYEPITTRTDMWSVGVLTYVLLTGFLPFGGESDQETFVEISKCNLDFPSELFEDVTPEAIDFISNLLTRKPDRRMSARDCLNHKWMRKDGRRPTPPSTLNLISPLTTTSFITHPLSELKDTPETPSIQSQTTQNVEKLDEKSSQPTAEQSTENPSEKQVEKESEQQKQIPFILSQSPSDCSIAASVSSPSTDIGRPPLHPAVSQKSIFGDITPSGTPGPPSALLSSSPFVYRQESRLGSKHNLDRLRSLSKSREVLSERVQMSNLKKNLSKSRERLCDARLGVSKSREQLMALSHFSQSVEGLSAISHLRIKTNNLHQSCNNIFIPKPQTSQVDGGDSRMFQSLASIDQIHKLRRTSNIGQFESCISLNDMLTQRNTDMNCFVGNSSKHNPNPRPSMSLRGSSCKGGRVDSCDKKCSRHKQPEAQLTQKITKLNRSDKLKKDALRRRREKRELERQEKLKKEKAEREKQKAAESENSKKAESPSSPSFRRGSVCHVEQRIQDRHERLEKLEKEERKTNSKRHASGDADRHSGDKAKHTKSHLGVSSSRSRSVTPTGRKKSKVESPSGSDVSQASSMESVESPAELLKAKDGKTRSKKHHFTIPDVKIIADSDDMNNNNAPVDGDEANMDQTSPSPSPSTEPSTEQISEVHQSSESLTTVETSKTDMEVVQLTDEELEKLSVSERIQNFEKSFVPSTSHAKHKNLLSIDTSRVSKDLPMISEELSPSLNLLRIPSYSRTTSNTSDVGSTISEVSDCSETDSIRRLSPCPSDTELASPEFGVRTRSFSVHSNSPNTVKLPGRSRSNSFHNDSDEGGNCARPWGTVCSGSVARAFEKFNLKSPSTDGGKEMQEAISSPVISSPTADGTKVKNIQ